MRCPYCNQDNTRVVDSRPVEETNSIRRRRLCDSCGRRFTTYENVETIPLTVIKKNLNREQYDRNKLINGVRRACYKRPIASDKLEAMIDAIEGDIFNAEDKEISSTKIGEIVMSHLKDLDSVAYVRFASVYREFKDVSTFMDELKKFLNEKNPRQRAGIPASAPESKIILGIFPVLNQDSRPIHFWTTLVMISFLLLMSLTKQFHR